MTVEHDEIERTIIMNSQQWFEKGLYLSVGGNQVFVIDTHHDQKSHKPVLCILHGFPTSSYDYWKALPLLTQKYRVIIHDHLGFGFSDKPLHYSYSLIEQADVALAIWHQLGIKNATLLAHDYGTSVFTEILARDNIAKQHSFSVPINIEKVILCNGSMHIELAQLLLMQKLLRHKTIGPIIAQLSSKSAVSRNLRKIFVNPNQLSDDEVDSIWTRMNFNQGKRVIAQISRYTFERQKFWHRWIGALCHTEHKMNIIWPDKDPIAVKEMAIKIKQETKNSELFWLENLGHFPMLENAELWAQQVINCD